MSENDLIWKIVDRWFLTGLLIGGLIVFGIMISIMIILRC